MVISTKVDDNGRTLLHVAASVGKKHVCDWLLKHKDAQLNSKDAESGYTALHRAAFHGQIDVVRHLINEGANLSIHDHEGLTPMDHLIKDRFKNPNDVLKHLLDGSSTDWKVDTEVHVWGTNANFNLGLGHHMQRNQPTILDQLRRDKCCIAKVSMQKFHSAVLTKDGKVYTFGHGHGGRLGHGCEQPQLVPKVVKALSEVIVKDIALGVDHSLFLASKGGIWTCGSNDMDQLGQGGIKKQMVPTLLKGPTSKPSDRYPPALGISAARYHSVFWTQTEVYTWGLNGGQLGHMRGVKVPQPMVVSSLLINIEIADIACSDGATVVLTTTGELMALHEFGLKRRLTSKKLHDIQKIQVLGGHLSLNTSSKDVAYQLAADKLTERGGHNLQIFILTKTGFVFVWDETRTGFVQCVYTVNRQLLISDIAVSKTNILLLTQEGCAYEAVYQPRKLKPNAEKPKLKIGTQFVQFDRSQCDVLKVKQRWLGVHRAYGCAIDPKGKNSSVLQFQPNISGVKMPVVSDSTRPSDFSTLLQEVDEFDLVHDIVFQVSKGHRSRNFPAHAVLVSRASSMLATQILTLKKEAKGSKVVVKIEDMYPEVFEQCLTFVYTGNCKALDNKEPFKLSGIEETTTTVASDDVFECVEANANSSAFDVFKNGKRKTQRKKSHVRVKTHADLVQEAATKLGLVSLAKNISQALAGRPITLNLPSSKPKSHQEFHDVVLVAEDKTEFHLHLCILMARLEYFKSMFKWELSGNGMKRKELPFPSKSMSILIDWIYMDKTPPSMETTEDIELVCQTLVLADHVMADMLVEICELRATELLSLKNVTEIMEFAYNFGAQQLFAASVHYTCYNLAVLLESRYLDDISDECCAKIKEFYVEHFGIQSRRLTPFSDSPTSSELRELAEKTGVTVSDVFDFESEQNFLRADTSNVSLNTSKKQRKSSGSDSGSYQEPKYRRNRRLSSSSVSSVCSSASSEDRLGSFDQDFDYLVEKTKVVKIDESPKRQPLLRLPATPLQPVKPPVSQVKPPVKAEDVKVPEPGFIQLTPHKDGQPDLVEIMRTERQMSGGNRKVSPPIPSTKRTRKASWRQMSFDDPEPPKSNWTGWAKPSNGSEDLGAIMQAEKRIQSSNSVPQTASTPKSKKSSWKTMDFHEPVALPVTNPWTKAPSPPPLITPSNGTTFKKIMSDEAMQKQNFERAKTKSLMATQIEERAIMELESFYNVNGVHDEIITVSRSVEKQLATPIWNPKKGL